MAVCNINTVVLTIAVVLIMVFADEIFTNYPVLLKLFTDATNFILLNVLVVLILLVDMSSGILLAFLVLYLSVWVKNMQKKKQERFSDIITSAMLGRTPLSNVPREYTSESEINYEKPPISNGNIAPFNPVAQSNITVMTPQINTAIACNQGDSISQVGAPNRDGYDCTGCRYDMKNSPQNLTTYGPPLARCGTYDTSKIVKCGTLFYPLNA